MEGGMNYIINKIDIQNVTRTAPIIFAEESLGRKTETIKKKFIEAIFVLQDNRPLTIQDILDHLEDSLSLIFHEQEVLDLLKDENVFEYIANEKKESDKYKLIEKRFRHLKEKENKTINTTYEKYIRDRNPEIKNVNFEDIMQRYLYYLLNTNIEAFNAIIKGSIPKVEETSESGLSSKDIDIINDFLQWDDDEKNKDLFRLANYCIEYAIVVNNSKESMLSTAIKSKHFYIDNALIYRAIGINGEQRKKRTLTFLKKCTDTGQKLFISSISRKEFFESIDYHIDQLNKSTPFGRIDHKLFRKIAGSGIYSFYHEWKDGKLSYGFNSFRAYVTSLYNDLLKTYNIQEDFKCIVSDENKHQVEKYEEYASGIRSVKTRNGKSGNDTLHIHDAKNILWIELLRGENNQKLNHTKYYFVTSDMKLQSWDYKHASSCQPVTLLPSQWLALLLKYTSCSSDDYRSFVSFLKIPKDGNIIEEDTFQNIMAGISEITEDLKSQGDIVSSMIETDFKKIINGNNIREEAKLYAKDKIEESYKKKLIDKETETKKISSEYEYKLSQQASVFNLQLMEIRKKMNSIELSKEKAKLESLEKELKRLEYFKNLAEQNTNSYMSKKRNRFGIFICAIIVGWLYITKSDWSQYEPYTYIVGGIGVVFNVIYFMVKGKTFNPTKIYEKVKENKFVSECAMLGFKVEEISDLRDSISITERNIEQLNKNML